MIPLVAALLEGGLSILGNAVLAKGKEVVEQTIGVKLPEDGKLTPDQTITLRKLEAEHEEALMAMAVKQAELDLAGFKVEVEDKASARSRDVEFLKAGLKNRRADFMFFLAVCVVVLLTLIVWRDESLNEYVKGIFTLVLGRFLGYLDNIYNFEFGSTRGSQGKDATIQELSKGRQK